MFQKNTPKSKEEPVSNSKPERPKPEPSKPSPRDLKRNSGSPSAERNVILSDVEIKGTVKFQNDVVIDGRIEGEIISNGCVTIGEKAIVKAEIKSKQVVVEGKVEGNICASDRLEINEHAEVRGDITSAVLAMKAGAVLLGSTTIGASAKSPAGQGNPSGQQGSNRAKDQKDQGSNRSKDQRSFARAS